MHKKTKRRLIEFFCVVALALVWSAVAGHLPMFGGSDDSLPAVHLAAGEGEGGLSIHFIDVGQGDAILLETGDSYILVDGGPRSSSDDLLAYLEAEGVERISLMVATHPHEDHIGGLDEVLDTYPVDKILMPRKEAGTAVFEDLLDAVESAGATITPAEAGGRYQMGDLTLNVLWPSADCPFEDANNWSVVLLAEYGNRTVLLMGDAEAEVEEEILTSVPEGVDLLKAGHHGSSTSSSSKFLQRTLPGDMVISCGAGNSYSHPHKETLEEAQRLGIQVHRTDLLGSIVFTIAEDGSIRFQAEKEGKAA